MALMSLSFRLSALSFCNDSTAHIDAGIHPIKVICKRKQIIAVSILSLRRSEREGKMIAIYVIKNCLLDIENYFLLL
jgi:hypothetical protein